VPTKSTGNAELAELVAYHVLGDEDFVENLAVVDQEGLANKLGNNGTPAGPGFDRVPNVGLLLVDDLSQELFVVIRSFF